MATRPSMHARDSSGRKVSLLNDEPGNSQRVESHSSHDYDMIRSNSDLSARSISSFPITPDLIRADSFDSNTNDPHSPVTPTSLLEFGRQSSYTSAGYKDPQHFEYQRGPTYDDYQPNASYGMPMRPSYADSRSSSFQDTFMYDEESSQVGSERGPKRYPCRYKDSHNCQKTFTTSGHASRHSKIHTAEKGVSCTWEGCQKKFTRADNMKQHLETHTKERSRSSGHSKPPSANTTLKALTIPAGVKKTVPARPASRNAVMSDIPPSLDPALFTTTQPTAFRAPNGLDTLAFAAEHTR